jgi:uncharacterized protein YcfL
MKKLIILAIVACAFIGCSKEATIQQKPTETYLFRAEAVSIGGTIKYSSIVSVTL